MLKHPRLPAPPWLAGDLASTPAGLVLRWLYLPLPLVRIQWKGREATEGCRVCVRPRSGRVWRRAADNCLAQQRGRPRIGRTFLLCTPKSRHGRGCQIPRTFVDTRAPSMCQTPVSGSIRSILFFFSSIAFRNGSVAFHKHDTPHPLKALQFRPWAPANRP